MLLSDLGERRILREIIPKYTTGIGDDCASVRMSAGFLSVSTDPCPRPAAEVLAGDDDPYWFGWPGRFWSHVLAVQQEEILPDDSPLFRPVSQVVGMELLNAQGFVECAMDTSDGLAPTLYELAGVNRRTIHVDLEKIRACCEEGERLIRSERAWMGWGDWRVVVSVSAEREVEVKRFCIEHGINFSVIGEFSEGPSQVILKDRTRTMQLGRLESERFAADSWFFKGVKYYPSELENLKLP